MNFLENSPLNATYISFQSYNKMISLVAHNIKETICAKVNSCGFFGVMFDETSDISSNYLLTVVIRYLDGRTQSGKISLWILFNI